MNYEKAASYWEEKDKESVKMDSDALKKKIIDFINNHNTCALAVASGDFIRCTPIEYNYVDENFYLFSEGGLKFRALKDNKNVCMAIYDEYRGFGKLNGLQVTGIAEMVEPWSEEYLKLLAFKNIPEAAIRKLPEPMNLIKIVPKTMEFLCSDLKNKGYCSRQHLEL
jgi:uncharacterized protein YhbP (UPF0306 family)